MRTSVYPISSVKANVSRLWECDLKLFRRGFPLAVWDAPSAYFGQIKRLSEDFIYSRIIPKYYISPQCGERRNRRYLHGRGSGFYPPSGGASRAFGLPQAAAKRILRAEARTHFPFEAVPTGLIDNNLITVAGYTGYPQKDLVWCASQRWGHAMPDLLRR